jgi:primosomal protein N' (replication factor Y)
VSNVTQPQLQPEVRPKSEINPFPEYVEVAVPLHVSQTFLYRLPEALRPSATVGARIVVPLGRNTVTGYIVALQDHLGPEVTEDNLKYAQSLVDSVAVCAPEILQISRWVSDYYASPIGEVIKATLPPGITPAIDEHLAITGAGRDQLRHKHNESSLKHRLLSEIASSDELKRDALTVQAPASQVAKALRDEQSGLIERSQNQSTSFVKAKQRRYVRLLPTEVEAARLSEGQRRVLTILQNNVPVYLQDLLKLADVGASTIAALEKRGLLETFAGTIRRDPLAAAKLPATEDYVLTPAQTAVLEKINEQIARQTYAAFLLHGVTGSGKTEVYIRAMRTALDQGRSAMMLVPEIALTPVFSRRLRAHFGDEVAIFHSSLQHGGNVSTNGPG